MELHHVVLRGIFRRNQSHKQTKQWQQLTPLLLRKQSNQRWLAAKNAKIRHFLA
jgi:hypothetical protein